MFINPKRNETEWRGGAAELGPTSILRVLTTVSDNFSTASGKNRATVSLTVPYSDTVTKTLLAVMLLPSNTWTVNVANTMILLLAKKEAMLNPRKWELLRIWLISFLEAEEAQRESTEERRLGREAQEQQTAYEPNSWCLRGIKLSFLEI